MSLFSRGRSGPDIPENSISDASSPEPQAAGPAGGEPEDPIEGDRGIPSINRARSIQSRVSSLLAISLMSVLGLGFLSWYYLKVFTRRADVQHAAEITIKNRAQGEMALPSIPHVEPPSFAPKEPAPPPAAQGSAAGDATTAVEKLFGASPPPPPATPQMMAVGASAYPLTPAPGAPPQKSPSELALERRLAGPSFAHASSEGGGAASPALAMPATTPGAFVSQGPLPAGGPMGEDSSSALTALLRPAVTPAVAASVLPTRRFLLAKGTFVDCTLETAIDSTLPGMATCVTATDTFSADGSVVLLERGTKLVGETRGQVAQGTSRLFVLWTEARTPTGVVVPLSSPGTDELGRSGLSGEVNRHFWDRFGAAILLTVINGAVQGAVQSQNRGSSVVVSPATSSDVMTEMLKNTVSISPTVTKAQGARIQVFVARDVDFRPVYALQLSREEKSPEGSP